MQAIVRYALCFFLAVFMMAFAFSHEAEAKRFGGGRSVGSAPRISSPSQNAFRPQQNFMRNQQRQGGFFSGFGGVLTGFFAGSLLGSLFSGHGFSAGSLGLFDLLIFGLLGYLLYRLFFRKTTPHYSSPNTTFFASQHTASAWDNLDHDTDYAQQAPSFDVEEFLQGAKILFTRMQDSWAKRDIDDIARFTSQDVLREIQAQYAADPQPETIAVYSVHAELLSAEDFNQSTIADVLFRADMMENATRHTVSEAWRFIRSPQSNNMWILHGIQNLD